MPPLTQSFTTPSLLAKEIGVDRTCILKAIKRGDLVARRLGRAWVIDRISAAGFEPRRALALK